MRPAPPVVLDAVPTTAFRIVQALLWAATAAAFSVWATQHLGQRHLAGWIGAGAAVLGMTAGWLVPACVRARLAWTGTGWELHRAAPGPGAAAPAAPEVAIDLGRWMLLRVRRPGAPAVWLEATEAAAGASWPAWRAAVYSSASWFTRRSPEEHPPS